MKTILNEYDIRLAIKHWMADEHGVEVDMNDIDVNVDSIREIVEAKITYD